LDHEGRLSGLRLGMEPGPRQHPEHEQSCNCNTLLHRFLLAHMLPSCATGVPSWRANWLPKRAIRNAACTKSRTPCERLTLLAASDLVFQPGDHGSKPLAARGFDLPPVHRAVDRKCFGTDWIPVVEIKGVVEVRRAAGTVARSL